METTPRQVGPGQVNSVEVDLLKIQARQVDAGQSGMLTSRDEGEEEFFAGDFSHKEGYPQNVRPWGRIRVSD